MSDSNQGKSTSDLAHDQVEWAKQKLDEVDAVLASVESSAEKLAGDARDRADRAIAEIRAARDRFAEISGKAVGDTAVAAGEATDALAAQWQDMELRIQSFLAAVADHAEVVKTTIAARVEAQRKCWQASIASIRSAAACAIDHSRAEIESSLQRLSAETEKAQSALGRVSAAGDESWQAIKAGLDDARAASERTWKRITEAMSKAR